MHCLKRMGTTSLLAISTLAAWLGMSGCDQPAPTTSPAAPAAPAAAHGGPMGPPAHDVAAAVDETGPYAAGKKVFAANGCGRCHQINGAGGPGAGGGPPMMAGGPPGAGRPGGPGPGGPPPGGPGGPPGGPPGGRARGPGGISRPPDLGKVGSDPEHTVEWLVAFIRDPKSKKPEGRMPAYAGKINDQDLQALAEYLASLTGAPPESAGEAPTGE